MLFSFFDPITYQAKTLKDGSKPVELTDIYRNYAGYFKRVAVNYSLRSYFVQGSPRPEELAYRIYGNTQLYWVFLFCNNIYDPYYGWITNQEAAYNASEQRYRFAGGNQTIYHVNENDEIFYNLVEFPEGSQVYYDKGDKIHKFPQYTGPLAAVDAYEAAINDNEALREIKIIDPNEMDQFITDLIREMEQE